ncbi:molecular chaperone [Vibrio sagamiensis]|uniref:Molecular chaperone n=1 Tax=Vibrio sagamiensis NBRC 104589 TaxID=1219064 RepID=A0A511QF30_9VIBR|nr:molecular chaperone [Vibrio sagamiensis]PNQ54020.1 molecular chaperone [Vibrio agarivorans]GEM75062.1 molecular chaperone [Vibrio sagamiensis NBRC 104589]
MKIGFDYGTANCSVAKMTQGEPQLLNLEENSPYIPSSLSAPTREAVTEYLFRYYNIKPLDTLGINALQRAMNINREESIELQPHDLAFGQAALNRYLDDPSDIYYVKSPKSFLGSSGLNDTQLNFFEDLVCAMMANIKSQAELNAQESITDAMIGRPINFHGRGGELANIQAERILHRAANRAGFNNVEFQFEPVAAGLEYESTLSEDKLILVVDIGGGTTDCSLIQMGPSWRDKTDRKASILGHSGQRIGGNDFDIALAFKQLMLPFGMESFMASGLMMPTTQFWNPIAINNVAAQNEFYSKKNLPVLQLLQKQAQEPQKLARLLEVYSESLGYHIVQRAEESKIALSDQKTYQVNIDLMSERLDIDIQRDEMIEAIESPKSKVTALVSEAVAQASVQPDAIFMTGGAARSPILREAVQVVLPNIPIVSGNYFGSVTAGLARWAELCFR